MFKTIGDKYLFDMEEFKEDVSINIVFDEQKEQAEEFITYIKNKGVDIKGGDLFTHNLGDEGIAMSIGEDTRLLRIYYKEEICGRAYEKFIPYNSLIFEEEKVKYPKLPPIPELKEGFIIEGDDNSLGIFLGGLIRHRFGCSKPEEKEIKAIYRIKNGTEAGVIGLLNYDNKEEFLELIWENKKPEQSLDNVEVGSQIKIRLKNGEGTKTFVVGQLEGVKILLDGANCYMFDEDNFEILGEVD